MKIGILKETKIPVDNRVALSPSEIKKLQTKYPNACFKVQSSDVRAYTDDEYRKEGIDVVDNVNDCDFMLGIKEADKDTLVEGKHYLFFGHIAKKQEYNIPLFKTFLDKNITFSDYEYLVDEKGIRLVAFGWFAGIVGLYYTLMGWGLKNKTYTLPMPHMHFSIEEVIENIKKADIRGVKIVVTGSGRVSSGAQHILKQIGAVEMSPDEYIKADPNDGIIYTVTPVDEMVTALDGRAFDFEDFKNNPKDYRENFGRFAKSSDILLSCHFWGSDQPIYLDADSYRKDDFRIKMIGDITCDIQGSIMSTLRSSTHANPFYDYNKITGKEEEAFSNPDNVTVMAVDTCPNALPRVTSEYFGEKLTEHVLEDILRKDSLSSEVLDRATIVKDGDLTPYFSYLREYVDSFRNK